MKKLLAVTVVTMLSGCYSYSPQQVNTNQPVLVQKNNISKSMMRFTFSLKDAQSMSRVKSVDAYLVSNPNDPSSSNIYPDKFKYQVDVVNGNINITFSNFPSGGPYYLALQTFDDIISSSERKNITAMNNSITSTNKQFAISVNSVIYSSSIVYSDGSNSLNIAINLLEYNDLPINLSPENGNNTPTNNISVG